MKTKDILAREYLMQDKYHSIVKYDNVEFLKDTYFISSMALNYHFKNILSVFTPKAHKQL